MVDVAHSLRHTQSSYFDPDVYDPKLNVSAYRRIGKRLFDIVFALAALPIVGTVILLLWWLVQRDGAPGFFGHTRVGKDGQKFRCWKLRTMVPDAEDVLQEYLDCNPDAAKEWERDHKLQKDPRITRIGAFLRQTSLDELPQFWNVLCGEMSVVGPRPIVPVELRKYGKHSDAYLAMKPGVTGLWQVSGRNSVSYAERVALDMDYGNRMTLRLDLSIVLKTAITMACRTGQ